MASFVCHSLLFVFVEECLEGTDVDWVQDLPLKRSHFVKPIDWRWGQVVAFVKSIVRVSNVLRATFDVIQMARRKKGKTNKATTDDNDPCDLAALAKGISDNCF